MKKASRGGIKTSSKGKKQESVHSDEVRLIPIALADEIHLGDSLADKLTEALRRRRLRFQSGDILVVKHKIVSKSEGRLVDLATIEPSAEESRRGQANMASMPA